MFSPAAKTKDSPYFRQIGSSPLEIYYSSRLNNGTINTAVQAVNVLRATPFHSGQGGKFDRLLFEVSLGGAAGAVARVGIYSDINDDGNFYPDKLIVDSGEFSTTVAGVKSSTIDITLDPDRIYWMASTNGVNTSTMRVTGSSPTSGILGLPSTLGFLPRTGFSSPRAYAALPSVFPSGYPFATGAFVEIVLRRYA